ncbi:MAG: SDR family oxidoreductase [Gracilibacteraceae bacterium]|jgi:NAD(P)-dependent dehydrogenase (short-subunit alcohol dehydrogenase family)|nr:SDR family oxidoreductase [Gracilibacteraceae bacterium]
MKLPFSMDLKNKVVVITGGTGVLGSYWADALAECGAKVAILSRNLAKAEKKAAEVAANGKTAIGVEADILNKASLRKAHEVVLEKFGPCDILINGAGGNNLKGNTTKEYMYPEDMENKNKDIVTFFDLDEQGIRSVFDANFLGVFMTSQEFAKDMVGRKGCSIINISSMNAFTPLTKIPAYSGAKAAVSNFTQWLAVHFSKVGIRVNAIAPGFFLTNQNAALLKNADGSLTERSHKILNSTPMSRFGNPEELVGAIMFLANEDAASFINGIVLPIDGGFSAYSGV